MEFIEFAANTTLLLKAWFTRNVYCTVFLTVLKWVECIPLVPFTHEIKNVKEIKGVADKNGNSEGKKQQLKRNDFVDRYRRRVKGRDATCTSAFRGYSDATSSHPKRRARNRCTGTRCSPDSRWTLP